MVSHTLLFGGGFCSIDYPANLRKRRPGCELAKGLLTMTCFHGKFGHFTLSLFSICCIWSTMFHALKVFNCLNILKPSEKSHIFYEGKYVFTKLAKTIIQQVLLQLSLYWKRANVDRPYQLTLQYRHSGRYTGPLCL